MGFFDEKLIYQRLVWSFDSKKDRQRREAGEPHRLDRSSEIKHVKPGDTMTLHATAPNVGKTVYCVTRIDREGVWGTLLSDTLKVVGC